MNLQTQTGSADFAADVELSVRPPGVIVEQPAIEREHDTAVALPPQGLRTAATAGLGALAVTSGRPRGADRVRPRPSTNLTPDAVLRRVSLPRTMSRRTRPVSTLAEAVLRRRHEASVATSHAGAGADLADGGLMSPITSADVRPPAVWATPSSDRPASAHGGILQRGLAATHGSSVELTTVAPEGSDPSARSRVSAPRPSDVAAVIANVAHVADASFEPIDDIADRGLYEPIDDFAGRGHTGLINDGLINDGLINDRLINDRLINGAPPVVGTAADVAHRGHRSLGTARDRRHVSALDATGGDPTPRGVGVAADGDIRGGSRSSPCHGVAGT